MAARTFLSSATLLLSLAALPHGLTAQNALTLSASPQINILTPITHFAPAGPLGISGTLLAVADFDGNGKIDMVVRDGNTVNIQLNGVGAPQALPFDLSGATFIAAADFNGDSKMDLAVVTNGTFINILLGNGNGTFADPVKYLSPNPLSLVVADVNADNKLDLAVSNGSGSVSILLGNGGGSFAAAVNYPASGGFPIIAADFNGDNNLDLATLSGNDRTVGILLGNGDGTFQAPLTSQVVGYSPSPYSLAPGDFNNDGNMDLAIADFGPGRVVILIGNGDGTFGAPTGFTTGTGAQSVAVRDLNGDGNADLVVANLNANTVSSLFGKGDGSFQAAVNYSLTAPTSALILDWNGDNKLDALVPSGSVGVNLLPGSTLNLTASSGTPQAAAIGTAFANPLEVTVVDDGTPVDSGTVTFTVPASGASATLPSGTAGTNASGVASVIATANNITGAYTVTATYQGESVTFALTNTPGSAASIVASASSTPQLAAVGAAYANPLQVTVKDAGGNPLSGVTVTFTAPASGASATLSAGTAVTNASGVASVIATANNTAGPYVVTASVGALSAVFSLTNTLPQAAGITANGGTPQTTAVNTAFGSALQALVKDSAGHALSGVTVTWAAPSSGASATLSAGTAVTNASGTASVTATANNTTGSYAVSATIGGVGGEGALSAFFSLTNTSGPPSSITATGGTPQSAQVGVAFVTPLQVVVRDAAGNPSVGITVTFTAPASGAGATLSSGTATTNGSGVASVTATANGTPGSYLVTASAGGHTATFSLTNTSGQTGTLVATGGTPQSTGTGTPFASALQVTLRNGSGNPVAGATVTFTVPASGASATLSSPTAITNAAGVASVTATANSIVGSYTVGATANGLTTSFSLSNTGQALNLRISGVIIQTTAVNTPFPNLLQVTVTDALNNTVGGVAVTFTAPPTSSASAILSTTTATTNGSGVATVSATANSIVGSYTVAASLGGLSVTFNLTNTAGQSGSLTATGGTPQSAALGTNFGSPLQVTLRDSGANPVGGVTVTFTAPGTGPSAVLSSTTAVTNVAGVASVIAAANLTAGDYVVSATAAGLSTQFSLSNTAAGAANLAVGRIATQSSTLSGYASAVAGSAVDGNTDGGFFNGSVTHTNSDANAWWQVDLGASAIIDSVVVWNRTDACCVSRLADYWVFISDLPFGTSDTPATLQNRPFTYSSHQTSAPMPSTTITTGGAQGRYVRIQLSGTNNLSLAEVQTIGNYVSGPPPAATNLAVGKIAGQSSTYIGSPTTGAGAAVDGNTDGNFFNSSVTHTNAEANAWWQVDLGASAAVNSITIFNRTDCCGDRLSDYWVFVSDTPFNSSDTPATLQNRANTFSSHQTTAPNPSTSIDTSGAQGRYVRVQLSGTNNLSLAEVQVFGTFSSPPPVSSNLALNKSASQSSTLADYPTTGAGGAVDGNTDGNFFNGSVTHTNSEANAWWQVDLGSSSTVNSVVVWNRTDCCGDRLGDYWVFVSNTPFGAADTPATLQNRLGTFSIHQTSAPGPSDVITVPGGFPGRYVRIQLNGTGVLSLAEVQVFGTAGAPTNLAPGKTASQSSTLAGYGIGGASAAIDNNTDGNFFDGSVTHTNSEANAWWQVDLGASANISSVVVWNRTDCCGDRLGDYWVFVSDTPFSASDTPATLQSRAATFSSHQTGAPHPSTAISMAAQGRYVRVQLSGTNNLSLAEVQVMGQ